MDEKRNFQIEFQPLGIKGRMPSGLSLLECARRLQIDLISVCGGRGTCGKCRIRVTSGEVSELTITEAELLSSDELQAGYRLACCTRANADLVVDLPAESLSAPQRIQVEGIDNPVTIDPVVKKRDLSLSTPTLSAPQGDDERLFQSLERQHGMVCRSIDRDLARHLSRLLRSNDWKLSAAIRDTEIIAVRPWGSPCLGVAIDLGTTKVAGYLVDLETGATLCAKGVENPQISYGDDIIARINRCMGSSEDASILQQQAVSVIEKLTRELCAEIPDTSTEAVDEFVVVGNTAMHHLLLRLPVEQLARAPHVPAMANATDIKARELGLSSAMGAYVHLLPNIGGFIGGDHLAVLLAIRFQESHGPVLALDIGTNTEVSLIANGEISTLACASGPAFEGAHISCGVRATSGAIDHLRIENDSIAYHTIQNREPIGFCGSGIFDALAQLFENNIVNKNGRITADHPRVREKNGTREFVFVSETQSHNGRAVVVTQEDIRELQLAKAAIQTGVSILLKKNGLRAQDLGRIVLAGAFGSYIDIESAIAIGMLPALPMDRYQQVGNAAGTGARVALINAAARETIERIARDIRYIELATVSEFNKRFIESIAIGCESSDRPPTEP
jgi:uncharacterized 2Fe-2S/4Fe-4S cluster protein (DUF4445 family)